MVHILKKEIDLKSWQYNEFYSSFKFPSKLCVVVKLTTIMSARQKISVRSYDSDEL